MVISHVQIIALRLCWAVDERKCSCTLLLLLLLLQVAAAEAEADEALALAAKRAKISEAQVAPDDLNWQYRQHRQYKY